MKTITLSPIHDFKKTNSVTIHKRGEMYDTYKCTRCGIEGKRTSLAPILQLNKEYPLEKICNCTGFDYTNKFIKIIQCNASGTQWSNLTPSSIHTIIDPPSGYANGDNGVWVTGNGADVKVLFDEFIFFEPVNIKTAKIKRTK